MEYNRPGARVKKLLYLDYSHRKNSSLTTVELEVLDMSRPAFGGNFQDLIKLYHQSPMVTQARYIQEQAAAINKAAEWLNALGMTQSQLGKAIVEMQKHSTSIAPLVEQCLVGGQQQVNGGSLMTATGSTVSPVKKFTTIGIFMHLERR